MKKSILMPLNDSMSSKKAVDFIAGLALCAEEMHITLLHVFKKPSISEELVEDSFLNDMTSRYQQSLENAKDKLIEGGYNPENIDVQLVCAPFPTVTEGIIEHFKKGDYSMVVLGRKRMSKAEEFVKGDIGVKLVRALEDTAVLVVKSL